MLDSIKNFQNFKFLKSCIEHIDELVLLPEHHQLQLFENPTFNAERNWRSEGQQRRRERERNERSIANPVHAPPPARYRGKLFI